MRSKSTLTTEENIQISSNALGRTVQLDLYFPPVSPSTGWDLLLINDGQDLEKMDFERTWQQLYDGDAHMAGENRRPFLVVGIHAGPQRKMEYGTAASPDYAGRGALAGNYTRFILDELLPALQQRYPAAGFARKAFAGWSLGALSAMDIVWAHPGKFSRAGLFSGSFWWRTKDKTDPEYNDHTDRIMHQLIRAGQYHPGLRFFFECGTDDETEDRNHNGIIDSIDDTQDLIKALIDKGYHPIQDITYLEISGGQHNVDTWGRVMPAFLEWLTT